MKTEIQSAAVYRVRDKATHETFYLVQSDSQAHLFYEVRFDNSALIWRCNCGDRHIACKHQRAVSEVLRIRRLALTAAMGAPIVATVKEWQRDEDRRLAEQEACNFSACRGCGHLKHGHIANYVCDQCRAQERETREKLPLNGNRPFSLMR